MMNSILVKAKNENDSTYKYIYINTIDGILCEENDVGLIKYWPKRKVS